LVFEEANYGLPSGEASRGVDGAEAPLLLAPPWKPPKPP
jgi:hypothetical protein